MGDYNRVNYNVRFVDEDGNVRLLKLTFKTAANVNLNFVNAIGGEFKDEPEITDCTQALDVIAAIKAKL